MKNKNPYLIIFLNLISLLIYHLLLLKNIFIHFIHTVKMQQLLFKIHLIHQLNILIKLHQLIKEMLYLKYKLFLKMLKMLFINANFMEEDHL